MSNYFGIKKSDANLDEIREKLSELDEFSITYKTGSFKLVGITSAGGTWPFLNSSDFPGIKF